jgi:hypothetical protein
MSLGSIYLNLKTRYGKGLRVAWYRDKIRPAILETRPLKLETTGPVELHVLTSGRDWLNLVWALKSFYHYSERRFPLCIHEDGSLGASAVDALSHHFQGARIIRRAEADKAVLQELASRKKCLAFRASNPLAIKVFDFSHYLEAPRMLLFDSDLLFFSKPDVLLQRLESQGYLKNSVNRDVKTAYTIDPADFETAYGCELPRKFNSGLGVIHQSSMNWDWFEEFLGLPNVLSHHWRIEQTLFAMTSARHGTEFLPPEYDVYLGSPAPERPVRHYVGEIRHKMYGEGMRRLRRAGFLNTSSTEA